MPQTIKISSAEAEILRKEAPLNSRSIAGQAEHWLRLGRAIEKSPDFDYQRVREALAGLADPRGLTEKEDIVYWAEFADSMWESTATQKDLYAGRRRQGLGVGLDEDDNLVYQEPED